jgi:hypothetical protein
LPIRRVFAAGLAIRPAADMSPGRTLMSTSNENTTDTCSPIASLVYGLPVPFRRATTCREEAVRRTECAKDTSNSAVADAAPGDPHGPGRECAVQTSDSLAAVLPESGYTQDC